MGDYRTSTFYLKPPNCIFRFVVHKKLKRKNVCICPDESANSAAANEEWFLPVSGHALASSKNPCDIHSKHVLLVELNLWQNPALKSYQILFEFFDITAFPKLCYSDHRSMPTCNTGKVSQNRRGTNSIKLIILREKL